jgi:hypothetical protein
MARDTEQPELSLLSSRVEQRNDDRSADDEERGLADRVPSFRLL